MEIELVGEVIDFINTQAAAAYTAAKIICLQQIRDHADSTAGISLQAVGSRCDGGGGWTGRGGWDRAVRDRLFPSFHGVLPLACPQEMAETPVHQYANSLGLEPAN